MTDDFVWRHGGDITVLNGSRGGDERRGVTDRRGSIAKGIFAVNVQDRRAVAERRQIAERRMDEDFSSMDWLMDITSSIFIGIFLLSIGIVFLILGITIFPVISAALGLILIAGGTVVIFVHAHTGPKYRK